MRSLFVLLAILAIANATPNDCTTPSIQLSTNSAVPGEAIEAKVSALPPSSKYTVRVAKKGLSPLLTIPGTTDASGGAIVDFTLPSKTPLANYSVGVAAVCNNKPISASTVLVVANCTTPSLYSSLSSAHAGDTVIVQLSSYLPSAAVIIRVMRTGLAPLLTINTNTSPSGSALVSIALPSNAAPANYTIGAIQKCQSSFIQASVPLQIVASKAKASFSGALLTACPPPTLSMSADSVVAGASVTLLVTNALPQSSVMIVVSRVGLSLSPLLRLTAEADAGGSVTQVLDITSKARAGNYSVAVAFKCDDGAHVSSIAYLQITTQASIASEALCDYAPSIAAATESVFPGDEVPVTFSDLPPNAAFFVRVSRMSLAPLVTYKGAADDSGFASFSLEIPVMAPANNYSLGATFKCGTSNVVITGPVVQVMPKPHSALAACPNPVVTLSAATVSQGEDIAVKVSPLTPSTAFTVRIAKVGLAPILNQSESSDEAGQASFSVSIPKNALVGDYTIGVIQKCGTSFSVGSSALHISAAPEIEVAIA